MTMTLAALAFDSDAFAFSPFIVPVAGCIMILGIVLGGIWSGIRNREIQSTERLAAIAKGVPVPPTVEELALIHGKPSADSTRRRGNVRRAGLILVGGGLAVVLFFILLTVIIGQHEILSGAAAGLIPLGIGAALLIDARLQTREMEETTNSASSSHLSSNPNRSL